MPTILAQLDAAFRRAIRSAFGIDADPILAVSQNEKFGDYQSNAAMGLAKQLGKKPREVAEQIKAKLELAEVASEIASSDGRQRRWTIRSVRSGPARILLTLISLLLLSNSCQLSANHSSETNFIMERSPAMSSSPTQRRSGVRTAALYC